MGTREGMNKIIPAISRFEVASVTQTVGSPKRPGSEVQERASIN